MKNTLKKVIVIALAALMLFSLASCAKKLSGTYTADKWGTGTKMVFDGNKVTVSATLLTEELASVSGTYEIKDNQITFNFVDENASAELNDVLEAISGTHSFEEGEGYIKIGDVKYTKEATK